MFIANLFNQFTLIGCFKTHFLLPAFRQKLLREMKNYPFLILLSLSLVFMGCPDPDPPVQEIRGCTDSNASNYNSSANTDDGSCIYPLTQVQLIGEYTNTNGNNPLFVIDDNSTSDLITYSLPTYAPSGSSYFNIYFNSLGISDEENNYEIISIDIEEDDGGGFVLDNEFQRSFTEISNVGVVLALDVSQSLGSDFSNVLSYADDFVSRISNNTNQEAEIGIVAFSTLISTLQPTSNFSSISSFINQLTQDSLTALHDAVMEGLDMITQSGFDKDSKSIVTFTDGRNNNSVTDFPTVVARLENLRQDTAHKLKSYSIGLRGNGNLQEDRLEQLAVGGKSKIVDNATELQSVFDKFSKDLSSVYKIQYRRGSITVANPIKFRFTFHIQPK